MLYLFMVYLEGEEEGHNWVFSAEQIGDEVPGMIKSPNNI